MPPDGDAVAEPEARALLEQVLAVKDLIDAEEARNRARVEAALPKQARGHLATATTLYHEMGMTYWLEQTAVETAAL